MNRISTENPANKDGPWPRHLIIDSTDDESPVVGDLFGDGKAELDVLYLEQLSWLRRARPEQSDRELEIPSRLTNAQGLSTLLARPWIRRCQRRRTKRPPCQGRLVRTTRIAGGRPGVEIPSVSLRAQREFAKCHAYDVVGDGLADVITCLNPHGFGLAWYEQLPEKDAAGEIQFRQHLILNPDATPNSYGVAFSQPHSVALADMDGDGLKDIKVTGKRFWAHGKHGPDPQSNEPAVLYWFKLVRGPNH